MNNLLRVIQEINKPETVLKFIPRHTSYVYFNYEREGNPPLIPYHNLQYVLDGKVTRIINGKTYICPKNSFFWLIPETKYAYKFSAGAHVAIIYLEITGKNIDKYFMPERLLHITDAESILYFYRLIMAETLKKNTTENRIKLKSLFLFLLAELQEKPDNKQQKKYIFTESQQLQINLFIQNNVEKKIDSRNIAKILNLSRDYGMRIFKNTFGYSPRTYIMREKIKAASLEIMNSAPSIKKIAEKYGYDDIFLFSRLFKKVMGKSPALFRKENFIKIRY